MKKGCVWLIFLLLVPFVCADVLINEIMYNPSSEQADDTDLEWVELYNNGVETVDLSDWKIKGKDFEDVSIAPDEYVVLAIEKIDGGDADSDSFEAYYGNNDSVWNLTDSNYNVSDMVMGASRFGDNGIMENFIQFT